MKLLIMMSILAIAGLAVACDSGRIEDAGITSEVRGKLAADPGASALRIEVSVRDQIVTLTGEVPTAAEKARAETLARNAAGVRDVINNIVVNPYSANINPAVKKVEDVAVAATGAINDTAILTSVKSQLLAEGITGTNVDVRKGVVLLKGSVLNARERARAEEIAAKTQGVRRVDNLLLVRTR